MYKNKEKSKNKKHKKRQMSVKMGQIFKSFIILLGQNIFNTDIVQYTHYLLLFVNAVFLEFPFNRRIHILYKVFSNVFWLCHCNG